MRVRATILNLMALVACIAIGCAAVRNASPWWASVTFTLCLSILLATIVGVVAFRGRGRVIWAGAAVFGWAYLIVSFGPFPWLNNDGLRPPPLLTERSVGAFRDLSSHPEAWEPTSNPIFLNHAGIALDGGGSVSVTPNGVLIQVSVSPGKQISHCLWSMLLALVGAFLGRLFAAWGDRS